MGASILVTSHSGLLFIVPSVEQVIFKPICLLEDRKSYIFKLSSIEITKIWDSA